MYLTLMTKLLLNFHLIFKACLIMILKNTFKLKNIFNKKIKNALESNYKNTVFGKIEEVILKI